MDSDKLLFEELEPCCQKEIINNRMENELRNKLRQYDRSLKVTEIKKKVFCQIGNITKCECCTDTSMYPLLESLRQKFIEAPSLSDDAKSDSDESYEDLDEDFVSEYEMLQRENMQKNIIRKNMYESEGFGLHAEDSVDHLINLIFQKTSVVVHIFSPDILMCAQFDLVLENLARVYIGTKFRRLINSQGLHLSSKLQIPTLSSGTVLCFRNGVLAGEPFNISQFVLDQSFVMSQSDIDTYLDHLHMLNSTATLPVNEESALSTMEMDNCDEIDRYCEVANCDRNYPHKHIGEEMTHSALIPLYSDVSKKSDVDSKNADDVLDPSYFLKI